MSRHEITAATVADPAKFGSPTCLAMRAGDFIYVSGMIAWDAERRIVGPADPWTQTRKALENMRDVLRAGGSDLSDIVKITFYLTDIRHKPMVWEARKSLFGDCRPASTLVGVAHLVDPLALVEVDAVAYTGP